MTTDRNSRPGEPGPELPDPRDGGDPAIVAENVRIMGPMIVAAMFDELKAFEVVDRIVELSQRGMLPIRRGTAGRALYRNWRRVPNRIAACERRRLEAIIRGAMAEAARDAMRRLADRPPAGTSPED